jgi:hypothetical protein
MGAGRKELVMGPKIPKMKTVRELPPREKHPKQKILRNRMLAVRRNTQQGLWTQWAKSANRDALHTMLQRLRKNPHISDIGTLYPEYRPSASGRTISLWLQCRGPENEALDAEAAALGDNPIDEDEPEDSWYAVAGIRELDE